jgi:hypothetical protein
MIYKYLPIYNNNSNTNILDINIDFSSLNGIPLSCFNSNNVLTIQVNNYQSAHYYADLNSFPNSLWNKLFTKHLLLANNQPLNGSDWGNFTRELTIKEHNKSMLLKPIYDKYVNNVLNRARIIYQMSYQTNSRISTHTTQHSRDITNKTRLIGTFERGEVEQFTINNNKIIVDRHSLYSSTENGIYPLLIISVDKDRILDYKKNLVNQMFFTTSVDRPSWDCIKVYVDYDWYLNTPLKSLKNTILRSLDHAYTNFELVLFDGKKFANENMYSFQLLTFKTLAQKKNFNRKIEKEIYVKLLKQHASLDYSKQIQEFITLYQELVTNQKNEVVEEKPVEIVEERALTAEDMDLIRSLAIEPEVEPVADVEFEEDGPIIIATGSIFEQINSGGNVRPITDVHFAEYAATLTNTNNSSEQLDALGLFDEFETERNLNQEEPQNDVT